MVEEEWLPYDIAAIAFFALVLVQTYAVIKYWSMQPGENGRSFWKAFASSLGVAGPMVGTPMLFFAIVSFFKHIKMCLWSSVTLVAYCLEIGVIVMSVHSSDDKPKLRVSGLQPNIRKKKKKKKHNATVPKPLRLFE